MHDGFASVGRFGILGTGRAWLIALALPACSDPDGSRALRGDASAGAAGAGASGGTGATGGSARDAAGGAAETGDERGAGGGAAGGVSGAAGTTSTGGTGAVATDASAGAGGADAAATDGSAGAGGVAGASGGRAGIDGGGAGGSVDASTGDEHVHIFVSNTCVMSVSPAEITVPAGRTVRIDWHNHSADYPVTVWLSYGGGYVDLPTGSTWDEPIEHCANINPYTAYADISTACSRFRFFIRCL